MTLNDLTDKEMEAIGRMRAYRCVKTKRENYIFNASMVVSIIVTLIVAILHPGTPYMILLGLVPMTPALVLLYSWEKRAAKAGKDFLTTVRKSH